MQGKLLQAQSSLVPGGGQSCARSCALHSCAFGCSDGNAVQQVSSVLA